MKGKIFNNLDSLNEFVKNEWKIISNQTIKKTVDDVSNRLKRVIELEGAHLNIYILVKILNNARYSWCWVIFLFII